MPSARRRHRDSTKASHAGDVQPGRPLTKAEREARTDSVLFATASGVDAGTEKQQHSGGPQRQSEVSMDAPPDEPPTLYQTFVRTLIGLLIIFGSLYIVLEYLLSSVRASAECLPSTVYVPVTETVTSIKYLPPSSEAAPISAAPSTPIQYITIMQTVAYTETVTFMPNSAITPIISSTSQAPYSYVENGGTTSWLAGNSPSSGASLTIVNTAVTVYPVPLTPSTSTSYTTVTSTSTVKESTTVTVPSPSSQNSSSSSASSSTTSSSALVPTSSISATESSLVPTPTVTVPPYTSSVFSLVSPGSTTTLTSTHYTTVYLSAVSSHSSFAGLKSGGWNMTSTIEQAITMRPTTRTVSELLFFGTGTAITSTSTAYITTTLGATITQTITPSPFVASVSGSLTTITAKPTTITYSVQIEPTQLSDSIFNVSPPLSSSSLRTQRLSTVPGFPDPNGLPIPFTATASGLSSDSSPVAHSLPPSVPPKLSSILSQVFPSMNSLITGPGPISLSQTSSATYSNTSSPVPSQSVWSHSEITVTSFISGHGTTLTIESTPPATTPYSPTSSNSQSPQFRSHASESSTAGAAYQASSSEPASRSSAVGPSLRSSLPVNSTRDVPTQASGAPATAAPAFGSTDSVSIPLTPNTPQESSHPGSGSGSAPAKPTSNPSASLSGSDSSPVGSSRFSTTFASNGGRPEASRMSGLNSAQPEASSNGNSNGKTTQTQSQYSGSSPTNIASHASSMITSQSENSSSATTMATKTSSSSFSNPFPATSSTAIPSAGCGEQGDFTMTFDDLPTFHPSKRQSSWNTTGSNTTDITQYPPLGQRPYHHLWFSSGYVYAPKSTEPFSPVSSPNVAAFVSPNTLSARPSNITSKMPQPGEIGDPYSPADPSFYFNPRSAFVGCDNDGPDDCTVEAVGYNYDPASMEETPSHMQNYTVPPCPGYRDCQLQKIEIPNTYQNLTGLQFRAFVNNEPKMFFLDNVTMRWSNDSCAAGMKRQSSR